MYAGFGEEVFSCQLIQVSYIWKPAWLHHYYLDSITDAYKTCRRIKGTSHPCKNLQFRFAVMRRRKLETADEVFYQQE